MGKKRIWLFILAAALCLACILTACFWDTIVVYAAPKAVLSSALADTLAQLDIRFRYNPVRNLLDMYSPEGRYMASVELKTDTDLLGDISCDLQVKTDALCHQALAEGTIGSDGGDLSLSLYLNGDYMAVSSRELVNGKFYGIIYDTFASDLEQFRLVRLLIPDATMRKWENTLTEIQTVMNRPYEVPHITDDDVRLLMAGLLLLDSHVDREVVNGLNCYKITYAASGKEVRELLSYVLDTDGSQTAEITASFYLWEGRVIRIDFQGTAGDNGVQYSLWLGAQCLSDDLQFTQNRTEKGESTSAAITVSTSSTANIYRETVLLDIDGDSASTLTEVGYSWNSNNGDMILSWNQAMPIRLNLTRNEEGLHVVTEDFAQLMGILMGRTGNSVKDISCTMTLKPGTAIEGPEYIPMSQWSSEDLLTLLKGLGGLIGFSF